MNANKELIKAIKGADMVFVMVRLNSDAEATAKLTKKEALAMCKSYKKTKIDWTAQTDNLTGLYDVVIGW